MSTTNFDSIQSIAGLASGLDTTTIISELMSIEKQPQVLLQQKIAIEQARKSALSTIATSLSSLQTAVSALGDPSTWGDVQTVTSSDSSRVDAVRTGGAAAGSYDVTVASLASAQQIAQTGGITAAAADDVLHIAVGTGSAVNVNIAKGDSLQTIADKINGSSGIGVYATISNGNLVLSGKKTGSANTISVTSDKTLATDLSFSQTLAAADASYTLNGTPLTSASNVVSNAIVGVQLTLKAKTSQTESITVGEASANTSNITNAVQTFVNAYNNTVNAIVSQLNQQKVANPTTDADRAQGVLEGDTTLTQILDKLRDAVSDPVSGRPMATSLFSQVGVSTGDPSGTAKPSADSITGYLTLDSDTLTSSLTSSFDDVKALFANTTGQYSTEGLSQRLGDILNSYTAPTTGLLSNYMSDEDSLITSMQTESSDMDVRLNLRQEQLQTQFTNMETALSSLQSQSSWLTSQINSLSSS